MNLEAQYQEYVKSIPKRTFTLEEIIPIIDFTLLDENASEDELAHFSQKAQSHPIAAVCVYPYHFKYLGHLSCKKATVANFPTGAQTLDKVFEEIDLVLNYPIDEIDIVFPYSLYLQGETQKALSVFELITKQCKQNALVLKVILETGAFKECSVIYTLSKILIDQGVDFLKTSTGKITQGATLPAVFSMLKAIEDTGNNAGIKISGGVGSVNIASEYINLASHMLNKEPHSNWFRIGSSKLIP